jgi:hypothetical protein
MFEQIQRPVMVPEEKRQRAVRHGWVVAVVMAPLFALFWFVGSFYFSLVAGGTLGGYGAAPIAGTAWWREPVLGLVALSAIVGDVYCGVLAYRGRLRKLTNPIDR